MTTIVSLIKQIYFFGKKITVYLLLLFPYWFGFFVPRNKNLWIFGAWFGERYSDNSRYVFEYINKNEPSIKAVWLSRKKEVFDEVRNLSYSAEMIRSWQRTESFMTIMNGLCRGLSAKIGKKSWKIYLI
ncbi:MAG: CDP-glycerol glycerophosphotransferase family protein [Calditrichaceae bacterium]